MTTKRLVLMVDPPSGWRYGFPKAAPRTLSSAKEWNDWLVSAGYPQELIDQFGEHFYCRHWEDEVEVEADENRVKRESRYAPQT